MQVAFNSDGTRIAIASSEEGVRVIQTFPTLAELTSYARSVVTRQLTPCERQRFFLLVQGVGDCPK
jgi:hypothetical protein